MSKVQDWNLKVSEFELELRHCIHFWTNTREEGINP